MSMKTSLLQTKHECYLCDLLDQKEVTNGLHLHHIFHGTANRRNADKWGCYVYLCPDHHMLGEYAAHKNAHVDLRLKQIAQAIFERTYSHEKFMEVFGKNYL